MPSYQREVAHEPDWIVEEARREPVQHYAISVGHTIGTDPRAPVVRPPPRPEPEHIWQSMSPQLVVALLMPALFATVTLLGISHFMMSSVTTEVHRASRSFQRVLNEDFVVVDSLEALGADSYQLQTQWKAVIYAATDVERDHEAIEFANIVESQARRVSAPGSGTWERANLGVSRIVEARDELLGAHRDYRSNERLLGPFAWWVRRPPIPEIRPSVRLVSPGEAGGH